MPSKTRNFLLSLLTTLLMLHWLRVNILWFFTKHEIARNTRDSPEKSKTLTSFSDRIKYLSYQPPGGGWNNQRKAFENAIIMAKILNRTLIVRPVASHFAIRELRLKNYTAGYGIYNMLGRKDLIPISKMLDLDRLRKLISVIEDTGSNKEFLRTYNNRTWRKVCHNPRVGFWVDNLPNIYDTEAWSIIKQKAMNNKTIRIPYYRASCKSDLKQFWRNPTRLQVWGISNELSRAEEDIIYFTEGSLFTRELYFMERKNAREARTWLKRYVTFAKWIQENVEEIITRIGLPFYAVHIRRTDFMPTHNFTQDFWLKRLLNHRQRHNITNKLYIASDEKDMEWFAPFREAGFLIFFSVNFNDVFDKLSENIRTKQDLIGVHEQLICTRATKFFDSFYSTFSFFISRSRTVFHSRERFERDRKHLFGPKWIGRKKSKRRK